MKQERTWLWIVTTRRLPAAATGMACDTRGVSIVEFALVLPLMATLLLGVLAYGNYFFLAHHVQQLANDAARSTIAGLTAQERINLATDAAITGASHANAMDATRLAVAVSDAQNFVTVRISYDASNASLFKLALVPLPDPVISRTAAVRMGGL